MTIIAGFLLLMLPVSASAYADAKTPVLVELFTSEGCSSCPPADALLRDLVNKQPIAGVQVVAVGFHVDYWNYIGWTDRFSSRQFTQRQEKYGRRFNAGPYTPQVVVDGRNQYVGSDRRAVSSAIAVAAQEPKPLRVQLNPQKKSLRVLVEGADSGPSDIFLVIVQNQAETNVLRGENSGTVLRHAAVARDLRIIGRAITGRWAGEVPLPVVAGSNVKDLKAVVFVQQNSTGQVLGVGEVSLSALE